MPQTPTTRNNPPSESTVADPSVINAINQMFAEFELVYHNQYHKAFSTKEKEDWAKKLWYNNLKEFSPQQILDAAHRAIKESDYLPAVHGVLKFCEKQGPILPLLVSAPDKHKMSKAEKQRALDKLRQDTGL
jgi:hypothetical protein